jgi:Domain of unknown function (DUF6265)
MRDMFKSIALSFALLFATPATAGADDDMLSLAWLEGAWEGTGVDGAPATEVYSPAAGGQMVGHFRQLKPDGSALFFELITIGTRSGIVTYSLKHFNPDLTGWEERETVRHFPLTFSKDDRWAFSGIVYERTGPDSMTVSVSSKDDNGAEQILDFRFTRVKR